METETVGCPVVSAHWEDRVMDGVRASHGDRVGKLFSYVVATDSGLAPNPFFGLCTLACCKPRIRKAIGDRLLLESGRADILELRRTDPGFVRGQNIWVVGLAGASMPDRPRRSVVYVMQVTDILDFESYYAEHPEKRPRRTGGVTSADPVWHGDAIYTGNDPLTARQVTPCAHSNGADEDQVSKEHDLGGKYVLVSDHFIYFGEDAPYIPLEEKLHHGRGHHSDHSPDTLAELESWLNGPWADLFNDATGEAVVAVTAPASARGCRGSR